MPKIYLSPSTQENNKYVTGGSEEYYMNLLADELEPYLLANGINFTRNTPDMTAVQVIRQSNAGHYDFHLALHSNASPEVIAGQRQGVEAYYYPYSYNGKRMAEIMVDEFRRIYPYEDLVTIEPTTSLGEVDRTRAPAVLLEIGYHDNPEDAYWITNNLPIIAETIAKGLTEYFGLPFIQPEPVVQGVVDTQYSNLNIRNRPNVLSRIVGVVPDGAKVNIYGAEPNGWISIGYKDVIGYVDGRYIKYRQPR